MEHKLSPYLGKKVKLEFSNSSTLTGVIAINSHGDYGMWEYDIYDSKRDENRHVTCFTVISEEGLVSITEIEV